ncbi:POK9 protein, partial [Sylvia borin]|nr:POK9 protein [Sylvia borin]NXM98302.1 POK9 protein [Sylvia borin]
MAAAFAAAKGTFRSSAICYGCGKPGHLKKDCFAGKGAKPKAPDLCPRCRKGHHFANQCHSKYDSEGCPVQGNQSQSVEQCHAPTQMPQPSTQMLPLQMPAPQAQPPRMPSGLSQAFA